MRIDQLKERKFNFHSLTHSINYQKRMFSKYSSNGSMGSCASSTVAGQVGAFAGSHSATGAASDSDPAGAASDPRM